MPDTHAQPTPERTDAGRALVKRAADLCRSRPAIYAAVVRRADALERDGISRELALDQALTESGS